jgi:hypothetical protein
VVENMVDLFKPIFEIFKIFFQIFSAKTFSTGLISDQNRVSFHKLIKVRRRNPCPTSGSETPRHRRRYPYRGLPLYACISVQYIWCNFNHSPANISIKIILISIYISIYEKE